MGSRLLLAWVPRTMVPSARAGAPWRAVVFVEWLGPLSLAALGDLSPIAFTFPGTMLR